MEMSKEPEYKLGILDLRAGALGPYPSELPYGSQRNEGKRGNESRAESLGHK